MEDTRLSTAEQIQTMTARLLATQPVGYQLCLIGGFRYRLLDASCRASIDLDYHWEGDLDRKQAEITEVLRQRLLPEVQRRTGYDGTIRPARGPDAESPAVRIVEMAFYRASEPGSRIEIPLEITRIPRFDPPVVRTVTGAVFLTVSDAEEDVAERLRRLRAARTVHVREIEQILETQVDPPVAANLRAAGGANMIWAQVLDRLLDRFLPREESP